MTLELGMPGNLLIQGDLLLTWKVIVLCMVLYAPLCAIGIIVFMNTPENGHVSRALERIWQLGTLLWLFVLVYAVFVLIFHGGVKNVLDPL